MISIWIIEERFKDYCNFFTILATFIASIKQKKKKGIQILVISIVYHSN